MQNKFDLLSGAEDCSRQNGSHVLLHARGDCGHSGGGRARAASADEAIVLESVPGSPGIVLAADEAISPAVREGMVVDEGASPAARGSALGEMPGGPKKAKRSIKGVKRSLQTALGDEPVFAEPPALLLSPRAVAVAEGKGAGKAQCG